MPSEEKTPEEIAAEEAAAAAEAAAEEAAAQAAADVIPDETPLSEEEKSKLEQVEMEAEALKIEKEELEKKMANAADEATQAEKRVRDAQDKMHAALDGREQATQGKTGKTFEQYKQELKDQFEEDPWNAVEKIITDIAYDREIEHRKFGEEIKQVEEKAYRRAMQADPDQAKLIKEVESLSESRPDLINLSFDQKLEFIQMQHNLDEKDNTDPDRLKKERDMLDGVSGKNKYNTKPEKMATWVNDPEVQKEAQGEFASKKEMADWANPDKARLMSKQIAKERQGE